jgi:hypothetical protein
VVTIAIDATDTPKVDPRKRYRLVTLPVEDRPDREFASLLRAAAETFSSAAVEAGSPLHGMLVGALDLTVVAVRPEETEPVVFPEGSYRLAPGDRLFVIGSAPELRYLDRAGEALDPSLVGPPPTTPAEGQPVEGIETDTVTPHDEDSPDQPARIGSETGIERDDAGASQQPRGDPEPSANSEPAQAADPEPASAADSDPAPTADAEADPIEGKADEATFEELKAEFDEQEGASGQPSAGEADWDEDEEEEEDPFDDVEIAFEDDASDETGEDEQDDGDDELVSLDEAEITFEDDAEDTEEESAASFEAEADPGESALGEPDIDEDLQGESEESLGGDLMDLDVAEEDDETDDLSDLEFEEDEDDGVFADESLEDDDVFGDDPDDDSAPGEEAKEDDDDENDEDDDEEGEAGDDDDDGGGGGGGKSFAELKEEFDSGDADWEEDVSDSPGGDMRLDE